MSAHKPLTRRMAISHSKLLFQPYKTWFITVSLG